MAPGACPFCVGTGAKNRASQCVGVEDSKVCGAETEPPLLIAELTEVSDEEGKFRFPHRRTLSRNDKRAKLERVVDGGKQKLLVLEAEQRGKLAVAHEVAKKPLGSVVRRDTRG